MIKPAVDPAVDPAQKKRKREELEESDPKLQEYLDVMQSGKNPAKKPRDVTDTVPDQVPPVVEGESDDEYEAVPSKPTNVVRHDPGLPVAQPQSRLGEKRTGQDMVHDGTGLDPVESILMREDQPDGGETSQSVAAVVAADDDDWLRQRTNRLLDLVGADELPVGDSQPTPATSQVPKTIIPSARDDHSRNNETRMNDLGGLVPDPEKVEAKESPIDTVHRTSRIFVRNLPYSASEEELHDYFGKFGELEEVSSYLLFVNSAFLL